MRAKELQIGNWVSANGASVQVTSLSVLGGDVICVMNPFMSHDVAYASNKVALANGARNIDELKPIPLTEEILEKNGMHLYNRKTNDFREEYNHCDCFDEDEELRLELSLDDNGKIRWSINGDEYTIIPLDYVHQLQQALRLCGIPKEIEL